MKCRADPACPYPARPGYRACRQHTLDAELAFTLHETGCGGRVRAYGELFHNTTAAALGVTVGSVTRGAVWGSKLLGGTERRGRPRMTSKEPIIAPRRRLPETRASLNHKFKVDGARCYVIVGLYPDTGLPGELFLKIDQVGSAVHGWADGWSLLFSVALQHGVPLRTLVDKFKHMKFTPAGVTDSQVKELRFADSIVDYVARWLEMRFL